MKQPVNKSALRKAGGPAKNPPVKTTPAAPGTKAPNRASSIVSAPKGDMRKWEVEGAMNTLMRAEDIKKDRRLMGDIKKLAAEQAEKMEKVCK